MNVALIGSVSSSLCALEALFEGGVEVVGALGLDESRAEHVSDYRSLREPARQAGIPYRSFLSVREAEVRSFLHSHAPDWLWVVGLSQLVPAEVIGLARRGGVGFHPTMLPRGRGRAPVAWTILLGESAAVSLFHLTDQPDAGDLIAQREVVVRPNDYAEDLIARTNGVLREVILELAPRIRSGDLPRVPQDFSKATYYPKRTPQDGLIDWSRATAEIDRLIRAAGRPYPGAFTFLQGRKVTVWRASPARGEEWSSEEEEAPPGTIGRCDPLRGAWVRTGDGGLWLSETAWEGTASGEQLRPGMRFPS
jgi:methionyl-tRNA formyltransferase